MLMSLVLINKARKELLSLICLIIMSSLLITCSPREELIEGKWSLSGKVIGATPSSFWFKNNGTVVANWKVQQSAFRSRGRYRFTDDTHIRITMMDGYYEGKIYNFEIIKNDENELILGDEYQEIKLKKERSRKEE